MASAMANVYYKLITADPPRKTIEDVKPESLREEVQALLDADKCDDAEEGNA